MEEEVKLLHFAKLLEELEEVVSVKTEKPMSPLLECCWLLSLKGEIKEGDNSPQAKKKKIPWLLPYAFLQNAVLFYLGNRIVCLHLEWELELSWLCACPTQNTKQKNHT